MPDAAALLPCAFCASSRVRLEGLATLWVECRDCHACGPTLTEDGLPTSADERAVEAWNRRPPAPVQSDIGQPLSALGYPQRGAFAPEQEEAPEPPARLAGRRRTCQACHGRGRVERWAAEGNYTTDCPKCAGTGRLDCDR